VKRLITLLALLVWPMLLWSETTLYPAKSCEAFNNLKHTQNRDNVRLDMHRTYTMLKHHKGQYLIKVPNATPSERWVDDDCLTLRPLRGTPLYEKKAALANGTQSMPMREKNYALPTLRVPPEAERVRPLVLAVSWQNAFCETHRRKPECRRILFMSNRADNRFTLHGLWPQPKSNVYCGVPEKLKAIDKRGQWKLLPEPLLSDATRKALEEVMPGVRSGLHRHEWIKHGTCYGATPDAYFKKAVALTRRINDSKLATLFRNNTGKRITLQQVRYAADRSFGKDAGKRIEMRCRNGLITELWIHLYGRHSEPLETMIHRARPVRSRCMSGIVDAPGFKR
jgi:ribonuclease T2